jgi:hypothetical protein
VSRAARGYIYCGLAHAQMQVMIDANNTKNSQESWPQRYRNQKLKLHPGTSNLQSNTGENIAKILPEKQHPQYIYSPLCVTFLLTEICISLQISTPQSQEFRA